MALGLKRAILSLNRPPLHFPSSLLSARTRTGVAALAPPGPWPLPTRDDPSRKGLPLLLPSPPPPSGATAANSRSSRLRLALALSLFTTADPLSTPPLPTGCFRCYPDLELYLPSSTLLLHPTSSRLSSPSAPPSSRSTSLLFSRPLDFPWYEVQVAKKGNVLSYPTLSQFLLRFLSQSRFVAAALTVCTCIRGGRSIYISSQPDSHKPFLLSILPDSVLCGAGVCLRA